jgi:hypothetical protein
LLRDFFVYLYNILKLCIDLLKMKTKKHITLIELLIFISLIVYIFSEWNESKVTVGHFFCLELLAMMFWYKYDNFKN